MKKTTMNIIALPLLALAFLPTLTNAANVDLNMNVGIGGEKGRPENRPENMPRQGTSTKDWNNGTTTRPTMMGGRSIGGLVKSIDGTSFSVESPSRNGTTTITVNTDTSTVFRSGTSTIAITDLSVGQRVSVRGDFATSTNSIAAKQVTVLKNMGQMGIKNENKGFFGKIIGWFKKIF